MKQILRSLILMWMMMGFISQLQANEPVLRLRTPEGPIVGRTIYAMRNPGSEDRRTLGVTDTKGRVVVPTNLFMMFPTLTFGISTANEPTTLEGLSSEVSFFNDTLDMEFYKAEFIHYVESFSINGVPVKTNQVSNWWFEVGTKIVYSWLVYGDEYAYREVAIDKHPTKLYAGDPIHFYCAIDGEPVRNAPFGGLGTTNDQGWLTIYNRRPHQAYSLTCDVQAIDYIDRRSIHTNGHEIRDSILLYKQKIQLLLDDTLMNSWNNFWPSVFDANEGAYAFEKNPDNSGYLECYLDAKKTYRVSASNFSDPIPVKRDGSPTNISMITYKAKVLANGRPMRQGAQLWFYSKLNIDQASFNPDIYPTFIFMPATVNDNGEISSVFFPNQKAILIRTNSLGELEDEQNAILVDFKRQEGFDTIRLYESKIVVTRDGKPYANARISLLYDGGAKMGYRTNTDGQCYIWFSKEGVNEISVDYMVRKPFTVCSTCDTVVRIDLSTTRLVLDASGVTDASQLFGDQGQIKMGSELLDKLSSELAPTYDSIKDDKAYVTYTASDGEYIYFKNKASNSVSQYFKNNQGQTTIIGLVDPDLKIYVDSLPVDINPELIELNQMGDDQPRYLNPGALFEGAYLCHINHSSVPFPIEMKLQKNQEQRLDLYTFKILTNDSLNAWFTISPSDESKTLWLQHRVDVWLPAGTYLVQNQNEQITIEVGPNKPHELWINKPQVDFRLSIAELENQEHPALTHLMIFQRDEWGTMHNILNLPLDPSFRASAYLVPGTYYLGTNSSPDKAFLSSAFEVKAQSNDTIRFNLLQFHPRVLDAAHQRRSYRYMELKASANDQVESIDPDFDYRPLLWVGQEYQVRVLGPTVFNEREGQGPDRAYGDYEHVMTFRAPARDSIQIQIPYATIAFEVKMESGVFPDSLKTWLDQGLVMLELASASESAILNIPSDQDMVCNVDAYRLKTNMNWRLIPRNMDINQHWPYDWEKSKGVFYADSVSGKIPTIPIVLAPKDQTRHQVSFRMDVNGKAPTDPIKLRITDMATNKVIIDTTLALGVNLCEMKLPKGSYIFATPVMSQVYPVDQKLNEVYFNLSRFYLKLAHAQDLPITMAWELGGGPIAFDRTNQIREVYFHQLQDSLYTVLYQTKPISPTYSLRIPLKSQYILPKADDTLSIPLYTRVFAHYRNGILNKTSDGFYLMSALMSNPSLMTSFPIADARKESQTYLLPQGTFNLLWRAHSDQEPEVFKRLQVSANGEDTVRLKTFDTYVKVTNASGELRPEPIVILSESLYLENQTQFTLVEGIEYTVYCQGVFKNFTVTSSDTVRVVLPWYKRTLHIVDQADSVSLPYAYLSVNGKEMQTDHLGKIVLNDVTSPVEVKVAYPNYHISEQTLHFANSGSSTIGLKRMEEKPYKVNFRWIQDGVEVEKKIYRVLYTDKEGKISGETSFFNTTTLRQGDYILVLEYGYWPFSIYQDTVINISAHTVDMRFSQPQMRGEISLMRLNDMPDEYDQIMNLPQRVVLVEGTYQYRMGRSGAWTRFVVNKNQTTLVVPVTTATFKIAEAGQTPKNEIMISLSGASQRTLIYPTADSLTVSLPAGGYAYSIDRSLFRETREFTAQADRNTPVNLRFSRLNLSLSAASTEIAYILPSLHDFTIKDSESHSLNVDMRSTVQGLLLNGSYKLLGYHYQRVLNLNDEDLQVNLNYVDHQIVPISTRYKRNYSNLVPQLKHRDVSVKTPENQPFYPIYVAGEPYEMMLNFKGQILSKSFQARNKGFDTLWIPTHEIKFIVKVDETPLDHVELTIRYDGLPIDGTRSLSNGQWSTELLNDKSYSCLVNAQGYRSQIVSWNSSSSDTVISIQLQAAQASTLTLKTTDGQKGITGRLSIRAGQDFIESKIVSMNSPIEINLPKGTYSATWEDQNQMTFHKEMVITDQAQNIQWSFNRVKWTATGAPRALKIGIYNGDTSLLMNVSPLPNEGLIAYMPNGVYDYVIGGDAIISRIDSVNLKSDRNLQAEFFRWTSFVTIDHEPAISASVYLRSEFNGAILYTDEQGCVRHYAQQGTYLYEVSLPSLMKSQKGNMTITKSDTSYFDFESTIVMTPFTLKFILSSEQEIKDLRLRVSNNYGDAIGSYTLNSTGRKTLELLEGEYRYNLSYGSSPFSYFGSFAVGKQPDSLTRVIPVSKTVIVKSMDRDQNPIAYQITVFSPEDQSGSHAASIRADEFLSLRLSQGHYPYHAVSVSGEVLRDSLHVQAGTQTDTLIIRWPKIPYYDLSIATLSGGQDLTGVSYRLRHADSVKPISGQIAQSSQAMNLASGIYYLELSKAYYQTRYDTITLRSAKSLTYDLKALVLNNKINDDTLCPDVPLTGHTLMGSQADAASAITYMWQKASQAPGPWTNLTSTQNYILTATDTEAHIFRRVATTQEASDTSNMARIRRVSASQHSLVPDLQTISYNNAPQAIQGHAQFAILNDQVKSYSWSARTPSVDSSWNAINGATSATYQAPAMKESQDFKRQVRTVKGCTLESTAASVHVRDSSAAILPTVAVATSSEITDSSALLSSKVLDNGGATISEVGFYYSTQSSPNFNTLTPARADLNTDQTFKTTVKNLSPGTRYYTWSYAINSEGRKISESTAFTTAERVGIQPAIQASLILSPNPNRGLIRIDYTGYMLRQISIRTIDGRDLLYWGQSSLGASGFELEHSLKAGIYILVIDTDQGPVLRKLNVVR